MKELIDRGVARRRISVASRYEPLPGFVDGYECVGRAYGAGLDQPVLFDVLRLVNEGDDVVVAEDEDLRRYADAVLRSRTEITLDPNRQTAESPLLIFFHR